LWSDDDPGLEKKEVRSEWRVEYPLGDETPFFNPRDKMVYSIPKTVEV
jgi:hypothetical protein